MTPYHLKTQLNQETEDQSVPNDLSTPAPRVFQGTKPALRNWRISSDPQNQNSGQRSAHDNIDGEDDDLFSSTARPRHDQNIQTPVALKIAHGLGVFVTIAWLVYAVSYLLKIEGGMGAIAANPFTLGGVVAGVLAPVALIWLALASWQRRSDATLYAEALRGELQRLLFPTQDQAHKINSDIQTLVAQAVEMSSSSRAAIKAISRARQGLRAEIRDFAGVSQKTEFHIDRLSETLNARAEQLLGLTQKIEERTNNIKEGSAIGVARWTEATDEMLSKANLVSNHVESVADKIGKAQASLTSQAGLLSDAGIRIADESQNFSTIIANNIERYESLTAQSKESLSSVHMIASEQERTLNELVTRNHTVHEKIAAQSALLNKAVSELSEKTSELDAVGQTAAHKLGEALSMALSGSDSISAAVRKTREQIERTVAESNQSSLQYIASAEQKVEAMVTAAATQFARLEAMLASFEKREADLGKIMERLADQNQNLVNATDLSVAKLDQASEKLNGTTLNLKQKVAEPLGAIEQAGVILLARGQDVQKQLSDRVADITAATENAAQKASDISNLMKDETQTIASLTGQLLAHTKGIEESLNIHKDKFGKFVSESENSMERVSLRVKDHTLVIDDAVHKTNLGLTQIETMFGKASEQSVMKSRAAVDEMRVMEQSVLEQLLALAAQSAQTQITLQNMELTLRDTANVSMPILDEAVGKADLAQARLSGLRQDYDVTADSILNRLAQVNAVLDDKLVNLNEKAQNVARNLSNLTHDLTETVDRIEGAANKADDTLSNLQSGLKGQADNMHLLTDQARLKVEAMQKIFAQSTNDITVSIGKTISDIETVTGKFADTTTLIEQRSEQSNQKVKEISRHYQDESARLLSLAETQAYKSVELLSNIKDQSVLLSDQSKQALIDLARANDSIAVRVREVDEYMKAALKNTQNYNDDLRAQAQLVARVSGETVDTMAEQISRLSLKADEARDIGNRLNLSLDHSRTKLSDETERLQSVARKAVDTADDAASAFARQSVTLYKAVQDVATYAERVKETQLRTGRDAFLASAKFVIESLHSLAVDVARHLESDIDERIWKQYQKGDMASFTKRLMELSASIDLPKAQKKFAEDGEFRNYVQRFIRGFEELFEQAQANDHGDLLASIFSTSQIGRVYALLCDISGRNSKLN